MAMSPRYHHTGVVLVRATTDPGDVEPPRHLNPADPVTADQDGRAWLAKVWTRPEVADALRLASPGLGRRLDYLLAEQASTGSTKDLRRAVVSVASYVLRWQRRATPFGLFAGVTMATIGPARANVGTAHHAVARPDAEWMATLVHRLEQDHHLRERLTVVADNTRVVRDGRIIVHPTADIGASTPGPLRESSVRLTRPTVFALDVAASPIRFHTLTDRLAAQFPAASPRAVHNLVHGLIDAGLLITSLRAAMTAIDTLPHLIATLHAADLPRQLTAAPDAEAYPPAEPMADIAELLDQLNDLHALLIGHNSTVGHGIDCGIDRNRSAAYRAVLTTRMTALAPGPGPVLAADVRLDANITVPESVLAEVALAADVLLRTGTQPFGTAAWLDYHARFLTHYGPSALVGVSDLIADSGLGYPTGYLGTPKAQPAWRTLTDRDAALLALIQHAALTGAGEIELTDTDVAALTVGDHATAVAPDRVEVGVVVCAASTAAIDRGEFRLRVTAAPRTPTSMAGRFAYLLDPADRARLAATYTAPPANSEDTVFAQMSFPPRRPHNENVVRVPPLLPTLVSLAEHPDPAHPDLDAIGVDDLGVTADADQMYLVRRSTGQRVILRIPHALDTHAQTPPLARFLAEIADARTTVFRGFDFGAARVLPYVPRIRYRRTVLAAARWLLNTTDLTATPGTTTGARVAAVDLALSEWRQRWLVPARVVLVDGELRLPLDLDHDLDRALLRQRLQRAGRVELYEDDPADAQGWVGRPAELLIPLAAITLPTRPLPVTGPAGGLLRPGDSSVLHAQLMGNPARFDDIFTIHLPRFVDRLCGAPASQPDNSLVSRVDNRRDSQVAWWWALRHHDLIRPDTDQHLAVFLRLTSGEHYGPVAAQVAGFAAELETLGLPCQLTLAPAPQHPARYGHGPAATAAERVFATDTRAAITQLATARDAKIPTQALAAVSMAHLTAAFAPDPLTGYRMLLDLLPRGHGALDRTLRDHTLALAGGPADHYRTVHTLRGGRALATAWRARDTALRAYHQTLVEQDHDPARVLRTLLHEHHVRAVGVDPMFEKHTGRLVRAIALRLLALAGGR